MNKSSKLIHLIPIYNNSIYIIWSILLVFFISYTRIYADIDNVSGIDKNHAESDRNKSNVVKYTDEEIYSHLKTVLESNPDIPRYNDYLETMFFCALNAGLNKEAIAAYEELILREVLETKIYSGVYLRAGVAAAYLQTKQYDKAIENWNTIWSRVKEKDNPDPEEIAICAHYGMGWLRRARTRETYDWVYLIPIADLIQDHHLIDRLPETGGSLKIMDVRENLDMEKLFGIIFINNILSNEYNYIYPAGAINSPDMLERIFEIRNQMEPWQINIAIQLSYMKWKKIHISQTDEYYLPLIARNIYHLMMSDCPKDYGNRMANMLRYHWDDPDIQHAGKILDGIRYTAQLADIGQLPVEEIIDLILQADRVRDRFIRQVEDKQLALTINRDGLNSRIENALRRDRNKIQSTLDILRATRETP